MAWSWFWVTVEMVKPMARLAVMNSAVPRQNSAKLPCTPTPNSSHDDEQDHRHLDRADDDIGRDLADHHLERPHRRGEKVLHRAALAFAGDGERGHHHHGHGEDHGQQAGHDVEVLTCLRGCSGAAARPRWNRRRCAGQLSGPTRSCASACSMAGLAAASGLAGRHRIGGVGVDQDLGALAAHQPAGEVGRDGDDELHRAALQQLVGLGFALGLVGEAHVAGVGQRRQDRARDLALVGWTTAVGRRCGSVLMA